MEAISRKQSIAGPSVDYRAMARARMAHKLALAVSVSPWAYMEASNASKAIEEAQRGWIVEVVKAFSL